MTIYSESDRGLENQFSTKFFLDEEHMKTFVEDVEVELARVQRLLPKPSKENARALNKFQGKLAEIKSSPLFLNEMIDGRTLRRKNNRELLLEISKKIFAMGNGNSSEMLMGVLEPYLRRD